MEDMWSVQDVTDTYTGNPTRNNQVREIVSIILANMQDFGILPWVVFQLPTLLMCVLGIRFRKLLDVVVQNVVVKKILEVSFYSNPVFL
jgi:hypothetical protein